MALGAPRVAWQLWCLRHFDTVLVEFGRERIVGRVGGNHRERDVRPLVRFHVVLARREERHTVAERGFLAVATTAAHEEHETTVARVDLEHEISLGVRAGLVRARLFGGGRRVPARRNGFVVLIDDRLGFEIDPRFEREAARQRTRQLGRQAHRVFRVVRTGELERVRLRTGKRREERRRRNVDNAIGVGALLAAKRQAVVVRLTRVVPHGCVGSGVKRVVGDEVGRDVDRVREEKRIFVVANNGRLRAHHVPEAQLVDLTDPVLHLAAKVGVADRDAVVRHLTRAGTAVPLVLLRDELAVHVELGRRRVGASLRRHGHGNVRPFVERQRVALQEKAVRLRASTHHERHASVIGVGLQYEISMKDISCVFLGMHNNRLEFVFVWVFVVHPSFNRET
mmetsp:Transcript_13089/g.22436  ORF Transcript_13089/g.22436 Transcript_13089/m.22436 type:complete len:396 (+) Transcript_13089:1098-2285(+)